MASSFVNNLVSGNLANSPSNPIYTATHTAPSNQGVYWIGADGNVYVKGSGGTNAAGRADANTSSYWNSRGFSAIADPNAPKASGGGGGGGGQAPNTPTGGGNGGGGGGTTVVNSGAPAAPVYEDKTADIGVNNAGYASVATQLANGLAGVDKSLTDLNTGYDTEKNRNEGDYKTNSDTNQNNLQKNKQGALLNAAQGRQGLFGTLASLGALNGDGIDLANNAVQKGANEDLSGATDSFASNQSALDASIKKFRDEDTQRRNDAKNEADNERKSIQAQAGRDRQTYAKNLSDDYRAEGKVPDADKWAALAASLFPEIAANTVQTNGLSPQAAAYTPVTLANYLAGVNGTQVVTAPKPSAGAGIALPGLVASNRKQQ